MRLEVSGMIGICFMGWGREELWILDFRFWIERIRWVLRKTHPTNSRSHVFSAGKAGHAYAGTRKHATHHTVFGEFGFGQQAREGGGGFSLFSVSFY
jgi:hypothetical protein